MAIFTHPRSLAWFAGLALALYHAVAQVPAAVDLAFFAGFVALLGIPHGAVDHLVSRRLADNRQIPFSMFRFLAGYLVQMLAYGLLWWWFPAASLWIFLLLSAWHFGESDLQPAPRHPFWMGVQLLLGSLVLFFILLRQPALTADMLLRITRGHQPTVACWQWMVQHQAILFTSGIMGVALLVFLGQKTAPIRTSFQQWGYWCLLMATLYFLPLLPAFALYFGGWHALNTFRHMSQMLGHGESIGRLWKSALPFTLLAAVFLVGIGMLWYMRLAHLDPLPLLFVFIAIITLPHLVVMHRMFSEAMPGAKAEAT